MKGSCVGCSSASITLKNGIENMLKHYVAEVTEVVAIDEPEEYE
jgi:NFU1 iron-sulfur cluster scaffold homolog, mitochondrial